MEEHDDMSDEEAERLQLEMAARIEAALEDYPDDCAVCGEPLAKAHHPDDPPVHTGCEEDYWGDGR
jgi:hypothetical protein